ncbi:cupin domain-containing protein [Sporosarcina aquimarina]
MYVYLYCVPAFCWPNGMPSYNGVFPKSAEKTISDTSRHELEKERILLTDYGRKPFVVNIEEAAKQNDYFRTTLWTGSNLQVTLMNLNPGESVGLEIHPDVDQFLRLEQGTGLVQMGSSKDYLSYQRVVSDDYAIVVPAGIWHNLTNTGEIPLKLYSIYAPPEHPFGTIHRTKADDIDE